ncbi:hypothetical protein ILYODFUR_032188 [Ilyodon furcidens]|uniref:Uncharacterized protein n=1 Tax=Ilyodon furcidens TaxID=33524 RepID=A0ABV0UMC2_9TELE
MMYMFMYSLLGRVASHHVGENQEAYRRKHLRATVKHGGVGMMIRACLTKKGSHWVNYELLFIPKYFRVKCDNLCQQLKLDPNCVINRKMIPNPAAHLIQFSFNAVYL